MGKSTSAKSDQPSHDELVPDKQARKECGDVCRMTIYRWERDPELQFPPAILIRKRKYRSRILLEQFKTRLKSMRRLPCVRAPRRSAVGLRPTPLAAPAARAGPRRGYPGG